MSDRKTTVYPPAGQEGAIARALLELADDPRDVATTTDTIGTSSLAFVVPEELGRRFEASYFKSSPKPLMPEQVPALVRELAKEEGALQPLTSQPLPTKLAAPAKKVATKRTPPMPAGQE